MQISDNIRKAAENAEAKLHDRFSEIDRVACVNTEKVLDSFRKNKVSESMFAPSTGYGLGDYGRDAADKIVAEIFGTEDGFIRTSLMSGTHTLSVGLFGLLRPGDIMLCVTGNPYDTIHKVIGIEEKFPGSLRDFGVEYRQVDLNEDSSIDIDASLKAISDAGEKLKVVYFQRSVGYSKRRALSVAEITSAIDAFHQASKNNFFTVCDNCYGEFTDTVEPSSADLIMGSLIKNPGGGMADTGGYIVGTKKAVELASYRLTCAGIGTDIGASLGQNRNIIKGLFYAPHTVAQALKTACLASYMFSELGYHTYPGPFDERNDIVQTIDLKTADSLIKFCSGIQSASPVDAFATPEPCDSPGYQDKIIMAAGAFVNGSSIELSADGPLREPYTAYMQGGLTYESGKLAVMSAAEFMKNK